MKRKFVVSVQFVVAGAILSLLVAACGGGGGGTGSTVPGAGPGNAYITALTTSSLRTFTPGYATVAFPGAPSFLAIPPAGYIYGVTSNGKGWYTGTSSQLQLISNVWVTPAPVTYTWFVLNAAGSWVANPAPESYTPNADGTLTVNSVAAGVMTASMVPAALSGTALNVGTTITLPSNPAIPAASQVVPVGAAPSVDANGNVVPAASSVIAASAVYPAGSIEWVATGEVVAQDEYTISTFSTSTANVMQTPAGPLAAMITFAQASGYTAANPLCEGNAGIGGFEYVYTTPQPALAANTARFNVYTGPCAAIGATNAYIGTVDFLFTTVRTQNMVLFGNFIPATVGGTNYFSPAIWGSSFTFTTFIAAPGNGFVYQGYMFPKGLPLDLRTAYSKRAYGQKNKTAMDAIMNAIPLPTF